MQLSRGPRTSKLLLESLLRGQSGIREGKQKAATQPWIGQEGAEGDSPIEVSPPSYTQILSPRTSYSTLFRHALQATPPPRHITHAKPPVW